MTQRRMNIIAITLGGLGLFLIWASYTYNWGLDYIWLPFTVVLFGLGVWNYRRYQRDKKARQGSSQP
jgi:Na+-driven multidrug efflux pump